MACSQATIGGNLDFMYQEKQETPAQQKSFKYKNYIHSASFVESFDAGGVRWVGCMEPDKSLIDNVHKEFNCTECRNRAKTLLGLIGPKGPNFCQIIDGTTTKNQLKSRIQVRELYNTNKSGSNWTLKVLSPPESKEPMSDMDIRQCYTNIPNVRNFIHYYINGYKSDEGVDHVKIQSAFDKYSSLVFNMLAGFNINDWEAIGRSIPNFKLVISEEGYAEQKLRYGILWLESIVAHISYYKKPNFNSLTAPEKMDVIGRSISTAHISKGNVLTSYHQTKDNILDLMGSAKDAKALKTLCNHRFSPLNYQQRTAAPSEGAIGISIKTLGDWIPKIMTVSQMVEKIPETVKVGTKVPSGGGGGAMSVMTGLIANKSKFDFESRSIGDTQMPDSMEQLYIDIKNGKIQDLMVDGTNGTTLYISVLEGFKPENLITQSDWGWCFLNGESKRFTGMKKVSHIVKIFKGTWENYIIILEESRYTLPFITTPVGWTDILSTDIRRTCGTTFAELSRKMSVEYPPCVPLAIGLGTSIQANNKLSNDLKFTSGKNEFSISKGK